MKNKNGFTLVELIAAITILGVLLLIGSQVVIDTMNKNKAKVVYTSMDNVSKQARLTFLEDPETNKANGATEISKNLNYNKEDFEIGRHLDSRIICLDLQPTGKFKNLKLQYFIDLKNKESIYCSHDINETPVYFFQARELPSVTSRKGNLIKTFNSEKRDGDYFFYLSGATCNTHDIINGDDLKKVGKYKVGSICQIFVSGNEYIKYTK